MSDAIVTPAQLATFHEELIKRRERLIYRLRSQRVVDASMIPLLGCTVERDVDRRTFDSEQQLLNDVDAAVQRLDGGAFLASVPDAGKRSVPAVYARLRPRGLSGPRIEPSAVAVEFRVPFLAPLGREVVKVVI